MEEFQVSKYVSKYVVCSSLLAMGGFFGATVSAGQVLDERTPAPPVTAVGAADAGVAAAAAAAAAAPVAAVVTKPRFVLLRDQRLSEQIRGWLEPLGWQLRWDLSTDWIIPADVKMDAPDVLDAVDQLARWMTRQGAPVQFVAFERNKILEARSLQPQAHDWLNNGRGFCEHE